MITFTGSYLSHLLGHESGGSILSALKQKLWANGLSAGAYLSNSDFASFTITVELSDCGVDHVDEIVACVFAYIGTCCAVCCLVLGCVGLSFITC
jgi:insulysin